jgi:hypothetical protein
VKIKINIANKKPDIAMINFDILLFSKGSIVGSTI